MLKCKVFHLQIQQKFFCIFFLFNCCMQALVPLPFLVRLVESFIYNYATNLHNWKQKSAKTIHHLTFCLPKWLELNSNPAAFYTLIILS